LAPFKTLARSVRTFVVGTGGAQHYALNAPRRMSEMRNSTTHGVQRLTLG